MLFKWCYWWEVLWRGLPRCERITVPGVHTRDGLSCSWAMWIGHGHPLRRRRGLQAGNKVTPPPVGLVAEQGLGPSSWQNFSPQRSSHQLGRTGGGHLRVKRKFWMFRSWFNPLRSPVCSQEGFLQLRKLWARGFNLITCFI